MEQLTTYRARGKTIGLVFLFKYDLNGNLRAFEIEQGELEQIQIDWLFRGYLPKDIKDVLPFTTLKELYQQLLVRMPATEQVFVKSWFKNDEMLQKFDISMSPADISFEALWNLYDYKMGRKDALLQYNKLKQGEIIKCFTEIPHYFEYLKKKPGHRQDLPRTLHQQTPL